nr:asparagine synthase-related protein [Sphingomonas melonis]
MGFGAPMSEWLKGDFGVYVRDRLLGSTLMQRGMLDIDYISRLIEEHNTGRRDNSLFIWTLFNLSEWYDYWVAGRVRQRAPAARRWRSAYKAGRKPCSFWKDRRHYRP